MEKLIELLNEWYQERYNTNTRFDKFENYGGNDYGRFQSNDNEHSIYEADVWTKKYGFISRLVENDKIDLQKVMEQNKNGYDITRRNPDDNFIDNAIEYDDELDLFLLMLLSIQDEPIRFLCEILE